MYRFHKCSGSTIRLHAIHSLELELSAVIANRTSETWHCLTREEHGGKWNKHSRQNPCTRSLLLIHTNMRRQQINSHERWLNLWWTKLLKGANCCRNTLLQCQGIQEIFFFTVVWRCRVPLLCWCDICHLGWLRLEVWWGCTWFKVTGMQGHLIHHRGVACLYTLPAYLQALPPLHPHISPADLWRANKPKQGVNLPGQIGNNGLKGRW